MEGLVLNPLTSRQLQTVAQKPPQALLLVAPVGSGKHSLALLLAAGWLNVSVKTIDRQPFCVIVRPEKNSISIAAVRELKSLAKLKTVGIRTTKRVIILEDAHFLTREAQNALLKLLEEPPADMILVLTTHSSDALLPTILSRTQPLYLKPVEQDVLQKHFKNLSYSDAKISSAYHLSGGRPGLMHAILEQDKEHPLFQQVAKAKALLTASQFERLASVDELAKQKDELPYFLDGLHRVCQAAFDQAIIKNDTVNISRWKVRLQAIHKAQSTFRLNANSKLILSNLFLSL